MADQELLKRLLQSSRQGNSCQSWNQWYRDHPSELIDLSKADLRGTDLRGVDLHDADLSEVNLGDVDLSGSHLVRANLSRADLNRTRLISADLTDAIVFATIFSNIDLRNVRGLDSVEHRGPSTIGSDTFYASHGEISDTFLRGCGLTNDLIGFVHSITRVPQYYHAIISYGREDGILASRLYSDFQVNGIRCWKYTEGMKIGDRIHREVDQSIRLRSKLLVIFSEHVVGSDWVASEVFTALSQEQEEGNQFLLPLTVDEAVRQSHLEWAIAVRRNRLIRDFSIWKDLDQYQSRFSRLLRDLKKV